ncbi:MAG: hypothetical protein H0U03_08995 [Actinobacteria bacterium]|nr:hypothetical protein [Actinomycetota bacterium]
MNDVIGGEGDQTSQLSDEELSRLAHDLKTPLAMIVGYAELLDTRDDEEIRREAPQLIMQAAERLSSALDQLLESLEAEAAETGSSNQNVEP